MGMFVTKKRTAWVGSGDVNLAFYKKGNSTIYISTFYQYYVQFDFSTFYTFYNM
jgi:hypothetical protein